MAIRTDNSCCGNNAGLVERFIGTAYDVVKTVYDNLGILNYIYDFLNQHGVLVTVDSVDELKALDTDMKYARVYTYSLAAGYGYTDYLYVETDASGVIPNDPAATGSWIVVASSSTGGSGEGGGTSYIPYVYAQGSALGGETTIAVPSGTVGVPFIIVEGFMNTIGYGFTYDAGTLTVTLSQPLETGDEVVLLLTGTPAVPDNPNISNWVQFNWLYNGGYAVGGEQVIAIPYTFEAIPAIYKNGLRYAAGLVTQSYTVDSVNQRILLTEPLATNDRLIVQIGGETTSITLSDRTIQEVARAANVHDNEVILSTNTTQYLNDMKILYDVVAQKSYGLPPLPTNVYINSVSNGQLTYSPGNIVVSLLEDPSFNNSRELWKRSLAEAGLTLVDGSFEDGATVSNSTDVVWSKLTAHCYSWAGTLPKTIPSNSTPESTGGIAPTAWEDTKDVLLNTVLNGNTGASIVGTASGKTVQQELDLIKSTQVLKPELYGSAVVTNHTDIFRQMAADAKAQGKKLYAAGNYILDASPTNPIAIEVSFDFSQATITCTTNDGASTTWGNTSVLFKIPQQATDVTSQFTSVNYARGMKKTDVTGMNGWLGMVSTDVWLQRKANSAATGSPQYKIEVNETDQNGILFYPNYFSYTAKPTVSYKPFVGEIECKMPKVILDGAGIGWVVFCERNNVNLNGGIIESKNNGFAMSFIEFNRCARCKLDSYTLNAAFPETYQGGYTVMLTQCSSIELSRLYSISGWSGIDGNYYRGLSVRDSTLLTVGGHCGVSDVFVENCEILNHCNGMGWGTWSAINCHHNLNLDKAAEDFWSTKYDYNNSWDGKVIVRDLKVTLHSSCTGHSVVTAMEPKADHSMMGNCPDIYVSNVEYDIANTNPTMDIRTINLGVSGGNNFEQYQALPQFHTVDGVTFGGGSTRYLGNTNYRVIFNERNYTNITSTQMTAISRGRYIAKVSNIELERLGRLNQDWLNAARVDGFKFTSNGTKQEIYIDRSAHVIPCTSAWTDMTITVTNQRMNKGFLDNAVTRTGNTSYNKITFNMCEIFGVGGTAPAYRSGIFDFVGSVLRWDSQSDKPVVSPSAAMGADFGSGPQVTGRIQACVIAPIPSGGSVDATLKSRVISNYVNAAVYTAS